MIPIISIAANVIVGTFIGAAAVQGVQKVIKSMKKKRRKARRAA